MHYTVVNDVKVCWYKQADGSIVIQVDGEGHYKFHTDFLRELQEQFLGNGAVFAKLEPVLPYPYLHVSADVKLA